MTPEWTCLKCGKTHRKQGEMRATGGFWAKLFDVQNRRFTLLTCTRRRYPELYRTHARTRGNSFDFFTN